MPAQLAEHTAPSDVLRIAVCRELYEAEPIDQRGYKPGTVARVLEVAAARLASGYKPGTRQLEKKSPAAAGERPWWASDDPQVWADNQERLRSKSSWDGKNIIGWKETGLSGGVGR